MSKFDRKLPRTAWLRLPAGHLVEGQARTFHRSASGISATAQEGLDYQKRKKIQQRLCTDSHDNIVTRDIGQQFRRLERHLPGSGIAGARDSPAKSAEPAYAVDGILSVSAKIYQFRRHCHARPAPDSAIRRRGIVPDVETGTLRRKTGTQLRQCNSSGVGWRAATSRPITRLEPDLIAAPGHQGAPAIAIRRTRYRTANRGPARNTDIPVSVPPVRTGMSVSRHRYDR